MKLRDDNLHEASCPCPFCILELFLRSRESLKDRDFFVCCCCCLFVCFLVIVVTAVILLFFDGNVSCLIINFALLISFFFVTKESAADEQTTLREKVYESQQQLAYLMGTLSVLQIARRKLPVKSTVLMSQLEHL